MYLRNSLNDNSAKSLEVICPSSDLEKMNSRKDPMNELYPLKINKLYQISFFQVNSTVGVIQLHVSQKQPQQQSCQIT